MTKANTVDLDQAAQDIADIGKHAQRCRQHLESTYGAKCKRNKAGQWVVSIGKMSASGASLVVAMENFANRVRRAKAG